MKKRMLTGLLSMAIAAASLTGCSGSGGSPSAEAQAPAEENSGTDQAPSEASLDYPEKNITIILPYGAGSSQEALLRVACKYVEEKYNFKKSFVIKNQEGGSGEMGLTAAYSAPADGYTLAMFHSPHIALKLVRGDACKFSHKDFKPITNFMTDPCSWLINSENSEKYPDFAALVEAAKAAPGTISIACGGVNTSEGRLIKQIQRATGAEFKIVPIDNDAEFVSMLRGNHVDALVTQVGDVMTAIEEGAFIPLCVGTNDRIGTLPDVPTLKELGYEIESYSMRSLAAPKGTPEEVYQLLSKAFDEAMRSPEVTEKAKELGVVIDYKTPDEVFSMWESIDKANREEWEIEPWN